MQFAAREYRKRLKQHGMLCSMSRKGDCWDCEASAEGLRGLYPEAG